MDDKNTSYLTSWMDEEQKKHQGNQIIDLDAKDRK